MPSPNVALPDPELSALTDELRESLAPGIQLLEGIGMGGMGHVFLGRDPLLKRQVAIKILSPNLANDPTARARFVREAEASAAVSHPNVVGIHLVGELPRSKTPYFVMQFIEGRSLADELTTRSTTSEARARRIIGEVASALAAAHARGLVHRDIKPANIMIEAETERSVVLDFGISAILERAQAPGDSKLTQAGTYLGTPTYMSPEQASGEPVTEKSDVYSLGAVAFELLAGRPPFQGQSLMVMAAHVKDTAPPMHSLRAELDPHFADLIDRCLAKDPASRPSAADVAQMLAPRLHAVVEWPPPGLEDLSGRGSRLDLAAWLLTTAILLFYVVLWNQPLDSSPRWFDAYSQIDDDASTWSFATFTALSALCVVVLGVAMTMERFLVSAARALRSGYPAWTIVDVAWDTVGDTGRVLNATGHFALLSAHARAVLVRLRRARGFVALSVGALTLVASCLWIAGAWTSSTSSAPVSGGDLLILLMPAAMGGACLLLIDRQMAARTGTSARRSRTRRLPTIDRSVVSSWLTSAGKPVSASESPAAVVRRIAVRGAAVLVLLATVYVAFVVYLSISIATRRVSTGKADAKRWTARWERDSVRPMAWGELEELIARAGVPSSNSVDSAAKRLLLGRAVLRHDISDNISRFDADTAAARAIGAEPVPIGVLYDIIMDERPETPTQLAALEREATGQLAGVWRRFARSAPYGPLWLYRLGALNDAFPWEFSNYAANRVMGEAGVQNMAAAYVALVRGHAAEAEVRARENIAVGRKFADGASLREHQLGMSWVGIGARLLNLIAKRTNNPRLATEAASIQAALQRWENERLRSSGWLSLFADPVTPAAGPYLARDHALAHLMPPTAYGELFVVVSFSYCTSAREILFGLHPGRRAVLEQIAAKRTAGELAPLAQATRRWYDSVDRTYVPSPNRGNQLVLRPLSWLGLDAMRNRMSACSFSRSVI